MRLLITMLVGLAALGAAQEGRAGQDCGTAAAEVLRSTVTAPGRAGYSVQDDIFNHRCGIHVRYDLRAESAPDDVVRLHKEYAEKIQKLVHEPVVVWADRTEGGVFGYATINGGRSMWVDAH